MTAHNYICRVRDNIVPFLFDGSTEEFQAVINEFHSSRADEGILGSRIHLMFVCTSVTSMPNEDGHYIRHFDNILKCMGNSEVTELRRQSYAIANLCAKISAAKNSLDYAETDGARDQSRQHLFKLEKQLLKIVDSMHTNIVSWQWLCMRLLGVPSNSSYRNEVLRTLCGSAASFPLIKTALGFTSGEEARLPVKPRSMGEDDA